MFLWKIKPASEVLSVYIDLCASDFFPGNLKWPLNLIMMKGIEKYNKFLGVIGNLCQSNDVNEERVIYGLLNDFIRTSEPKVNFMRFFVSLFIHINALRALLLLVECDRWLISLEIQSHLLKTSYYFERTLKQLFSSMLMYDYCD